LSAERVERRLAAILAADVAGYSRLMGQDEAGTLARLKALRRELIDPQVADHKGRTVKTTGDGLLIEFPSVVEAVACAVAVQRDMAARNAAIPADRRIEFRVGINSGDVIVEDYPNFAGAWHTSGLLRNWAGQPDIAIEHIEAAMRLSPRVRVGRSNIQLGLAHFLARRFNDALPGLLLAIQEDPSHPMPYRILAACYAHMGQLDDAREIVRRLQATTPRVIPDASFLRNTEHRELFLSGLRLAAEKAE
jgi:tetratricopeptide (TPR) repeat protein